MTTDDLVRTANGDYTCPYCGSFDVFPTGLTTLDGEETWECAGCLDYLDD